MDNYSKYDFVAVEVSKSTSLRRKTRVCWSNSDLLQECRCKLFMALQKNFLDRFESLSEKETLKCLSKRVYWDVIHEFRTVREFRRKKIEKFPLEDAMNIFDTGSEKDYSAVEWRHLQRMLSKVLFDVLDEREIDILLCDKLLSAGEKWGITESRASQIRTRAIKKLQEAVT